MTKKLDLLRVFLPFALGYFISYLFRTINAVIAPNLVQDVGLDPASLGLLTSAYFLAFALFQLPLGVLLDRFGPRRVEACLLLIAGTGSFIFSQAQDLPTLILGRALIGIGVSACLMAAFKAFTQWFPAERLPLANGVQMVSGGLGALAATTPVEAALKITDWRGIFLAIALLSVAAAIALFLVVPKRDESVIHPSLTEQLAGVKRVLKDRYFWLIAPWATMAQAAYLSIVSLWAGPWLRDIANYDRGEVATTLFGISCAMIVGYFLFGALTERLARRGIRPASVAATGMILFCTIQIGLTLEFAPPRTLWLLFGFSGTACILPYAILSQHFPKELAGRANTSLNLLVFLAAFAAQWLLGVIIGLWPIMESGNYHPQGYRVGFLLLITLQLVTAARFLYFHLFRSRG